MKPLLREIVCGALFLAALAIPVGFALGIRVRLLKLAAWDYGLPPPRR